MKVWIDTDELYPFAFVTDEPAEWKTELDLTEAEHADLIEVNYRWQLWQDRLLGRR